MRLRVGRSEIEAAFDRGTITAGRSRMPHQMRVGLRRLRAAISVFKFVVANAETDRIKAQLK
jgi:inorganic triphosphatase YgiF